MPTINAVNHVVYFAHFVFQNLILFLFARAVIRLKVVAAEGALHLIRLVFETWIVSLHIIGIKLSIILSHDARWVVQLLDLGSTAG